MLNIYVYTVIQNIAVKIAKFRKMEENLTLTF